MVAVVLIPESETSEVCKATPGGLPPLLWFDILYSQEILISY